MKALLRNLFRRQRVERELDDELAAYLEQLVDEKVAAGLPPDEARREARLELGGVEQVKEEVRQARAGALIDSLGQDLRHALRRLARDRGFTAAVVLTIALGIGINTAIFSIVNGLLLKPLPAVSAPGELVWLRVSSSYPDYLTYRDENDVFSGLAALGGVTALALGAGAATDLVDGELVSASYFDVLGVPAAQGRTLLPDDEAPGARPVAVIGHDLWQRRFGGAAGIVGRTVSLNRVEVEIVGVAPRGFMGAEIGRPRDLWVPIALAPRLDVGASLAARDARWLNVIGRLRPGVSLEQARAAMTALATRLGEGVPEIDRVWLLRSAMLLPVAGGLDPRDREEAVVAGAMLMAVVGLVLLIACANVGGLVLARATGRAREVAIRRALGATRRRVVRQLLTECLVLALLGGAAALLFASWAVGLLVRAASAAPIAPPDLGLDWRVLAFTLGASVVTALAFGLAPALQVSRTDVVSALKDEGGALRGRFRRSRLRDALVAVQVALSLPLLVGAGLFVRSLLHASATGPGFAVDGALLVTVSPGLVRYPEERGRALYRELVAAVEEVPGVERASLMERVPFALSAGAATVAAEGREMQVGFNTVGPGFFGTMGIALRRGRDLDAADGRAAVVSETLARELFPGEDPLGRRLRFGDASLEIVGVAADVKVASLSDDERPYLYVPLGQSYRGAMTLVARTSLDPRAAIPAVRARLRALDPELPLSDVKTLAEQMDFALLPSRLGAGLLGAFGLLAVVLCAVGVYGLVATSVRQRTREIGIRTALGARRGDVLKLLVREASLVVAVGLAAGLGLALLLARALASLFYGVAPTDPLTFGAISLLLVGVTLLATYLPARRALAVDPMVALRQD